MSASDTLTVALWATHLAEPLSGPDDWLARVEARLVESREAGAQLLVLPEYACAQWLRFAPETLAADAEIAWMAEQADPAVAALRELAVRHGVALLAGTIPAAAPACDPPFLNRAHLLLPDGRHHTQDKLCLTPDEREAHAWNLSPASAVRLVDWQGWKLAVAICLDSELPALAARLARYRPDLVLVPSMTGGGGFWRVTNCCRARAVELFTTVCMVGCIGQPRARHPVYTGGAGVFIPCEQALGLTGVAVEPAPADRAEGAGPLPIARDLPLGTIRRLRTEAAEVWPGAWNADHVTIEDT